MDAQEQGPRDEGPRDGFSFGPYPIVQREIYYETPLAYATVNLMPIVPGRTWTCFVGAKMRFVM